MTSQTKRIDQRISIQQLFELVATHQVSPDTPIVELLCPSCGKLLVNGSCPDEFSAQLQRDQDPNFDRFCRELGSREPHRAVLSDPEETEHV
jgi:hypothetical protein